MDRAREAISNNAKFSRAGGRFWELSGLMKCSECGRGMLGNSPPNGSRKKVHHYYRCRTRHLEGTGACSMAKNIRVGEAESVVWSFVTSLLLNPNALREGLDEMVRRELATNHGNPEEEAAIWLDRLAEADHRRTNFQDMAAAGLISFDELGVKLGPWRKHARPHKGNSPPSRDGPSACGPSSVTATHSWRATPN